MAVEDRRDVRRRIFRDAEIRPPSGNKQPRKPARRVALPGSGRLKPRALPRPAPVNRSRTRRNPGSNSDMSTPTRVLLTTSSPGGSLALASCACAPLDPQWAVRPARFSYPGGFLAITCASRRQARSGQTTILIGSPHFVTATLACREPSVFGFLVICWTLSSNDSRIWSREPSGCASGSATRRPGSVMHPVQPACPMAGAIPSF